MAYPGVPRRGHAGRRGRGTSGLPDRFGDGDGRSSARRLAGMDRRRGVTTLDPTRDHSSVRFQLRRSNDGGSLGRGSDAAAVSLLRTVAASGNVVDLRSGRFRPLRRATILRPSPDRSSTGAGRGVGSRRGSLGRGRNLARQERDTDRPGACPQPGFHRPHSPNRNRRRTSYVSGTIEERPKSE